MAAQEKKSTLFSKLGDRARKAHEANQDAPVDYGNAELPDGINGIAQLAEIKLGIFENGENKGKPFFSATGIVQLPEEHGGIPVAGLRTRIGPEPLCDTPKSMGKRKTFDDHYDWVRNEIRKLMEPDSDSPTFEEMDQIVRDLVDEAPYFRFRTWKGSKQTTGQYAGREPRVQHSWEGRIDGFDPGDPDEAMQQDGATAGNGEETREEAPKQAAAPATQRAAPAAAPSTAPSGKNRAGKPPAKPPTRTARATQEPEPEGGGFEEFGDIDSLAQTAMDNSDPNKKKAQERLSAMAEEKGFSLKQIKDAKDWIELAAMISGGDGAGTEAEVEEEVEVEEEADTGTVPAKGDMFNYHPIVLVGPNKERRPSSKPVEVKVVDVDEDAQTVKLQRIDDPKKTYADVPWSALVVIES